MTDDELDSFTVQERARWAQLEEEERVREANVGESTKKANAETQQREEKKKRRRRRRDENRHKSSNNSTVNGTDRRPSPQAVESKTTDCNQDEAQAEEPKTSDDNQDEALPVNVRVNIMKLRRVIDQLHSDFTRARELILDTARRLDEEHVVKQDQICRKIKELLKDKIQETKISEGWIEECLPTEYKRKYKAKPKSQLNHLLKHPPEQRLGSTVPGSTDNQV